MVCAIVKLVIVSFQIEEVALYIQSSLYSGRGKVLSSFVSNDLTIDEGLYGLVLADNVR